MKTIKVKYLGFWKEFDYKTDIIYKTLCKKYNVEIVDDNPDYLICSVFGSPYEYIKYPQVRIMFSGENYIPDFNLIDYAICSYPINYYDRSFYKPQFIDEYEKYKKLSNNRHISSDILNNKTMFTNLICSHEADSGLREVLFKELSKYKRVDSAGSYLNNMNNNLIISRDNDEKYNFQCKCKFSICIESTNHYGFITEKIVEAFAANTIPIYYGSSNVTDIFNKEAFINIADYNSIEDVVNHVKELDNNDNKYLEMLSRPIFVDDNYIKKITDDFDNFIYNIFDQPIEKAYRRSMVYTPKRMEDYIFRLKRTNENKSISKTIIRKIKSHLSK